MFDLLHRIFYIFERDARRCNHAVYYQERDGELRNYVLHV